MGADRPPVRRRGLVLFDGIDETAFEVVTEPLTDCHTLEGASNAARRDELAAVRRMSGTDERINRSLTTWGSIHGVRRQHRT